jgi:hypothetical protein
MRKFSGNLRKFEEMGLKEFEKVLMKFLKKGSLIFHVDLKIYFCPGNFPCHSGFTRLQKTGKNNLFFIVSKTLHLIKEN